MCAARRVLHEPPQPLHQRQPDRRGHRGDRRHGKRSLRGDRRAGKRIKIGKTGKITEAQEGLSVIFLIFAVDFRHNIQQIYMKIVENSILTFGNLYAILQTERNIPIKNEQIGVFCSGAFHVGRSLTKGTAV